MASFDITSYNVVIRQAGAPVAKFKDRTVYCSISCYERQRSAGHVAASPMPAQSRQTSTVQSVSWWLYKPK